MFFFISFNTSQKITKENKVTAKEKQEKSEKDLKKHL
jgi:hypothetical protein